jgi:hypothetical protein
LDFVATGQDARFALEVKWANRQSLNVSGDYSKLAAYRKVCGSSAGAFLCVFGRASVVERLSLRPDAFVEQGRAAMADFGVTKYTCRVFELASVGHG